MCLGSSGKLRHLGLSSGLSNSVALAWFCLKNHVRQMTTELQKQMMWIFLLLAENMLWGELIWRATKQRIWFLKIFCIRQHINAQFELRAASHNLKLPTQRERWSPPENRPRRLHQTFFKSMHECWIYCTFTSWLKRSATYVGKRFILWHTVLVSVLYMSKNKPEEHRDH